MKCTIDGCNKPERALTLCINHYYRMQRYGDPLGVKKETPVRLCKLDGCESKHYGKGYCRKHYRHVHEYGHDKPTLKMNCKECGKEYNGRPDSLFCGKACLSKWHRREGCNTDEAIRARSGSCSIDGCDGTVHAHGYCKAHAMRHWRYGDPLGGKS